MNIYCQLGDYDYMLPTTYQGNPETPLIFVFTHKSFKRNYFKKGNLHLFSSRIFGGELLVLGGVGSPEKWWGALLVGETSLANWCFCDTVNC